MFFGHSRTYLDIAGQCAKLQQFGLLEDLPKWKFICFFV